MNMQRARGYTLIETIVAIGLFAIVMLLVTGAYLEMIAIGRQAQAVASASDNLSFALESMARSIRTGHAYKCNGVGDCFPGAGSSFTYSDINNCTFTYRLLSNQIVEDESGGGSCPSLSAYPLTDPAITVLTLEFFAQGTTAGDNFQPQMTISVGGTINSGPGKTVSFTVETGATLRGPDI